MSTLCVNLALDNRIMFFQQEYKNVSESLRFAAVLHYNFLIVNMININNTMWHLQLSDS